MSFASKIRMLQNAADIYQILQPAINTDLVFIPSNPVTIVMAGPQYLFMTS